MSDNNNVTVEVSILPDEIEVVCGDERDNNICRKRVGVVKQTEVGAMFVPVEGPTFYLGEVPLFGERSREEKAVGTCKSGRTVTRRRRHAFRGPGDSRAPLPRMQSLVLLSPKSCATRVTAKIGARG